MLHKKFIFDDISLRTSFIYRGIAILMIAIHNFMHLLPPKIGENEHNFDAHRILSYIDVLINSPELFIQSTFAFLGHYGVQIFIFLSAYGLTKKYANSNISYGKFLIKRILKIYPLFVLSILLWAFYMGMFSTGAFSMIIDNWELLSFKLLLISNFMPQQLYSISGPWWFVSLIVQFYIVFPLMLKLYNKYNYKALMLFSLLGIVLTIYLEPILVDIHIAGTIITHLPEFSLGIWMATNSQIYLKYWAILLVFIIFILANLYSSLWVFSFSSILILLLIIFQVIIKNIHARAKQVILFVGTISMYIFYINGFMRFPWVELSTKINIWYISILLCILFLLTVVVVSLVMRWLDLALKDRLNI